MDSFLVWINHPQVLDDLETTTLRLRDVHVHSNVMLTGHHFRWTTRPLSDLGVVECLDAIFLLQRACLFISGLPDLQLSIQAGTRTARSELGIAWIEFVVLPEQFLTDWIAHSLVVVEAT